MTEPTQERYFHLLQKKKKEVQGAPANTDRRIHKKHKFVVTHTQHKPFQTNTYLSSCQNEFVSNSGSTSVAFMIRAATTALHIYRIKTIVNLNVLAMLP